MILGVIQVRFSSTRLPGKALAKILDMPVLWHIVRRVRQSSLLDGIAIATTSNPADEPIIRFARENHIDFYAGSENDILDRLYQTAVSHNARAIVRITGDCPLVDPGIIDQLVEVYRRREGTVDMVCNTAPPTFPDGLDLEVLPFSTLAGLEKQVTSPFWREWFVSFLHENTPPERLLNVENSRDISHLRWTLDYPEDLRFMERVFGRLFHPDRVFSMKEILELMEKEPDLLEINGKYARNEAYLKARQEIGGVSG